MIFSRQLFILNMLVHIGLEGSSFAGYNLNGNISV